MNQITIEFCAEDRVRLDYIIKTLDRLTGYGLAPQPDPTPAEAPVQAKETVAETPVEEHPVEEHPVENPFPEAPAYKLSDIQQKVVQLSAAGKKAEVRDIVKAYAEKVSAIPEDKFGEVMAKLTALE